MSTNSVLPGKSRLFPCSYTVSLNFFFWCAFLCIFALFLSHVYRVKKLFFCSNFLELSSCALSCCKTLFCSTFRNIQRINLFFCAHFCAFYIFPPLPPFAEKSWKNRYKNLYSPIAFQAVQHLHFLACVLIRVTVRVKCL